MKPSVFRLMTLVILPLLITLTACHTDEPLPGDTLDHRLDWKLEKALGENAKGTLLLPNSTDLSLIPQDPKNPLTKEKVYLGQYLFHETGLAANPTKPEGVYTYSCASCHHAAAGFQAGRSQGIAEGGNGFGIRGERRHKKATYAASEIDAQPIRTPSAMNAAFQQVMLWNGQFGATGMNAGTEAMWTAQTPKETNFMGYEGVETQAIAGLKVHRMVVDTQFVFGQGYKELFDAAFPDVPVADRYTREQAGKAIAAYERTLLANEAPFQRWLRGELDAMAPAEKRGAALFFGKAECYSCHNGPALNDMAFHALGMEDLDGIGIYGTSSSDVERLGRGGFTGVAADNYKFKVPQLYNLKDSPFYGHGATFKSLRAVVEYKNQAIPSNPSVPESQLADGFHPLQLMPSEVKDLVAFLENALYDPSLDRYLPDHLYSGFCFPNNDTQSRKDLGCQ